MQGHCIGSRPLNLDTRFCLGQSAGDSNQQDKLLPEQILWTENDFENLFCALHSFSAIAFEKPVSVQPLTLWPKAIPPLRSFDGHEDR